MDIKKMDKFLAGAVLATLTSCGGGATFGGHNTVKKPVRHIDPQVEDVNGEGDAVAEENAGETPDLAANAGGLKPADESLPEPEDIVDAPVGPAPKFAVIDNQFTIRDKATGPIAFMLEKGGNGADTAVAFDVDVSDAAIVDPAGVEVSCETVAEAPGTCQGTVLVTPNAGAYGKVDITLVADNGQLSASQKFTLFVTLNPTAQDDVLAGVANRGMVINIANQVLANDTVLTPGTLAVTEFKAPSKGGVLMNNGDGTITYMPPKDYVGEEVIDYTITDGVSGFSTGRIKARLELFFDDFNRVDAAAVGNAWVETELNGAQASILGQQLHFESDNGANVPFVINTFPAQTAGKLEWTFDFNFTRNTEGAWSFSMLLGKAGAGSAVNLAWGGGMAGGYSFSNVNMFATVAGTALTERQAVNGPTPIKVVLDFATKTYTLTIGNTAYNAIPFDADVAVDSVSFKTDLLNSGGFTTRDIDNVRVKKLP